MEADAEKRMTIGLLCLIDVLLCSVSTGTNVLEPMSSIMLMINMPFSKFVSVWQAAE